MDLHVRTWGDGVPVIALHPLGLESSAFAGLGRVLAPRGFRTIAVDLPGFGRTPAPEGLLTPAALAAPVVALARSLDTKPVVLGVSLGGRVALEAALVAPEAFRGVVPIAPYLPWQRLRPLLESLRFIDPGIARWMPFERTWPLLQRLSALLVALPHLREDDLAQAGMRFVYFLSCPATREAFFSAMIGLATEPAFGPTGLWTRLGGLAIPATFVWGAQDRLVTPRFARGVARVLPAVPQLILPCAGHWWNGPHHRCVAEVIATVVAQDGPMVVDDGATACHVVPASPDASFADALVAAMRQTARWWASPIRS
jgi:pimeloyl-ACP methyl ester carboxylesterase